MGVAFKQGEDICVALQTHINDVMLRRYSRTRNVPNGQAQGAETTAAPTPKPPGIEVYEKHVQEMSKLLEESQKKIDQAIHSIPRLPMHQNNCGFWQFHLDELGYDYVTY